MLCKYGIGCRHGMGCIHQHTLEQKEWFVRRCPNVIRTGKCMTMHTCTYLHDFEEFEKMLECILWNYRCPKEKCNLPCIFTHVDLEEKKEDVVVMIKPRCKYDGKCQKAKCPFQHFEAKQNHKNFDLPCKFDGGCKNPNCMYLHTVQRHEKMR